MRIKNTIIIILIIAAMAVPVFAFAHSGDTDSSGGHMDRSTGEYHYHHGYSAHQHPDGVCPYDNESDITTAQGRMSLLDEWNNAQKTYDRYDEGYDDGYDEGHTDGYNIGVDHGHIDGYNEGYAKGYEDGKPLVPKWCFVVFGVLILLVLILCIVIKHRNKTIIQNKSTYEHNMEKQQKDFSDGLTAFVNDVSNHYGHFYLHEIAQVPNHVLINDDLIPHQRHSFHLPEEYEFYCASPIGYQNKQITYHRRTCHHVKTFSYSVSVVTIASKQWAFKQCSKCKPEIPNLSWFYLYEQHFSFLEKNAPNRKKVNLARMIRPSAPPKEDKDSIKINYRD